jgi:hypothetical protein
MNNFVINKDINQQNGDTDKKLQHGTRQLAPYKGIGIVAPYSPGNNIKGKQGYYCQYKVADQQGNHIKQRVLAVEVIDKSGQYQAYHNNGNNKSALHS